MLLLFAYIWFWLGSVGMIGIHVCNIYSGDYNPQPETLKRKAIRIGLGLLLAPFTFLIFFLIFKVDKDDKAIQRDSGNKV